MFTSFFNAASAGEFVSNTADWLSGWARYTPDLYENRYVKIATTLDPMTALMRIALLEHYESGTRLRICENDIVLQPPSSYGHKKMQGVVRRLQGVSIDDLHSFGDTITTAAIWYQPEKNEEVCKIFKKALLGLTKLQETYSERSASASLEHWKMLLNKAMNEGILSFETKETSSTANNEKKKESAPLGKRVSEMWPDDELHYASKLLDQCDDRPNTKALQLIDGYLVAKVEQFRKIQLAMATTLA